MAVVKLSDICAKIGSGATPKGGRDAYCVKGISLVRSQNVLDFAFSCDGLAHINEEQANKLDNVELEEGDVLLNITGDSVARACMMDSAFLPARVNQHVMIVRGRKNKVLNSFLLYFLQWRKDHLIQLASAGATRNALTKGMIEQLELDLPSLEEQQKVVAILDALQEKIKNNIEINDNLLKQMIAIFKNAKDSSTWPEKKLEDILIFYDHMRKPLSSRQRDGMERNYPYYGATTIVDYVDNYIFNGTYILISEDGANVINKDGHPLIQYTYGKFWVNNHAHIVQGSNGFSEALLFALLKTLNIQSTVTGAAQPKVNQANLRNFATVLPNPDEAKHLSNNLNSFLNQMIENDKENASLIELRDTLLPKLMSGELDVSNIDL